MAFDRSKDKLINSKLVFDDPQNRLTVAIYQYNGGEPKIQVQREVPSNGNDWKYAKMGRLAALEVEAVMDGMAWALQELES
jgi:hypothetical protein